MKITFPNPSRSYDATKNQVRFWGYDSTIEITFFIEAEALQKLCPELRNVEAGFLDAFDATRKRIHQVADKVYSHGKSGSYAYILVADDF